MKRSAFRLCVRLKYIRPFESSYAIGHSAVAVSQVRDEVNRMRDMVAKNISDSFDSLVQYDEKLRKKVSEREEYIDFLNKGISEYIVSLMASEMNMSDSRKINGYYAIISNLERIGDHATDISELAIVLSEKKYVKKLDHIEEMARETMVMLIQSLEAYVEKDLDKAQKVIAHDDVIDDLFEEVKQELIELIRNHADEGEQAVDLLMVTKYFERIGDHATNIAEWVIFSITGQIAG